MREKLPLDEGLCVQDHGEPVWVERVGLERDGVALGEGVGVRVPRDLEWVVVREVSVTVMVAIEGVNLAVV